MSETALTPRPYLVKVPMAAIRVGDVLMEHGMRCLVIDVIDVTGHPLAEGGRRVYAAQTRILNMDYVRENRALFGGIVPADGSWTVQGIDSRLTARETDVAPTPAACIDCGSTDTDPNGFCRPCCA